MEGAAPPGGLGEPVITLDMLRTVSARLRANSAPQAWVAFVHPSVERDIRDVSARQRWRDAYREARCAGKGYLSPRQVLSAFPPFVMPANTGVLENVVFTRAAHTG